MKILHTSHGNLPDQRIERAAYIAKKAGHKIVFLGLGTKQHPNLEVFDEIHTLRSINNRQVVKDTKIRNEWIEAVDDISPDLIHSNDIIAAKFSSSLDYPMVYDDHEYWSAQRIVYRGWPLWKRLAIRPLIQVIPQWEQFLLSNYITITVSENIAIEHRKQCSDVFVLQNYCLTSEVQEIPQLIDRDGFVYVGSDFKLKKFATHRDMTGLTDFLEFAKISGLTRSELYEKLVQYRWGLLPFKANEYSKFSNSAKVFDYLNCGLKVLMTRPLFEAHGNLPYTYPFDNYSEMEDIASQHNDTDPREIMAYAHKHFVWETQQDKLFEAYNLCLEKSDNT